MQAKHSKDTENIGKIDYRDGLFWIVPTYSTETITRQMDHRGLWKAVRYFKDEKNNVHWFKVGCNDQRRRYIQNGKNFNQS